MSLSPRKKSADFQHLSSPSPVFVALGKLPQSAIFWRPQLILFFSSPHLCGLGLTFGTKREKSPLDGAFLHSFAASGLMATNCCHSSGMGHGTTT